MSSIHHKDPKVDDTAWNHVTRNSMAALQDFKTSPDSSAPLRNFSSDETHNKLEVRGNSLNNN